MISDQAMRAMNLIAGIAACKETGPEFWQNAVTRIVLDLDEAAPGHVQLIADMLADVWDGLPDKKLALPLGPVAWESCEILVTVDGVPPDDLTFRFDGRRLDVVEGPG